MTGILFILRGAIGSGLGMLGLTIFIAALIFSPSASARILVTGFGAVVCGIALAYAAVSGELIGETVEYHGGRSGFAVARPITRRESPEKFRSCTNWRWVLMAGFLGIGVVSFRFYRRLESTDWLS